MALEVNGETVATKNICGSFGEGSRSRVEKVFGSDCLCHHQKNIPSYKCTFLYNYTITGDSSYLDQFTMGEDVNEDALTISPISSKYGTTGGIHSDITVVLATSLYKNIVRIPKVATVISLAHTKVTLSAKRLIQTLDPPVKNRSSEVSVPRRFYDMMNRNDVRQTKNTSLRNTYLSMSIVDTVNW